MALDKDYYGLLEVSPRARPEVIHAAYRALMAKYHPDKKSGDEEVAKSISAAYKILSDSSLREQYDHEREHLEGSVVGEYRILEMIARGGFGKTYKGENIILAEPVCLKHCSKISPQYEQILINETKAMWDLRHYAIPAVRGLVKAHDGSMILVMSYIPGPTLEQIIQKAGRLDPEHVAWIAERILNALMYIHYNGIVHGDIKPQNIIVQPDSHHVSMVDFGLSMIKPKTGMDAKGYTPRFAPPEEMAGNTLLPESDFYSLGMTLIYALSGGIDAVARKEVPANTPDALCDFIKRLIVRDILDRPRWDQEDLCETMKKIRKKDFGRRRSGMKPIPGF